MSYSDLSIKLTKKLSKDIKKKEGIFFTPPKTIQQIIDLIKPLFISYDFINILENSCGSGEFINHLSSNFSNIKITGIEKNELIFNNILHLSNEFINIYNQDFINFNIQNSFDLIIGNPPFSVIDKKTIPKSYLNYFDGRPNIFIIFIIKSLQLLKINGILAYILPKNFLNCLYYNKTRRFIIDNYSIINIIELNDKYLETNQETILIIIKNSKNNNQDFFINKNELIIFNTKDNIKKINEIYQNSTSIHQLNFICKIGSIVWNENKNLLTNDTSKTRLIYNTDISNNSLLPKSYKNDLKKNFINLDGFKEPLLVINRGNGTSSYKFEYCLIDIQEEFLIENHLIIIKFNQDLSKTELLDKYRKIIKSFENPKTKEFIKIFFGNNAINIKELLHLFPIIDI